jgi:hypothetical protein
MFCGMPTSTPARTRAPKQQKAYADLTIVSRHADGDSFRAKIFDDEEVFTFSTDVNAFLLLNAYSGEPGAITDFMLSLIEVDVADADDDATIERKRADTRRHFTDILKTQKGLSISRLIQFTADLTDAAGNGNLA